MTHCGEIFRTSAVSSTLSPSKRRSSTTFFLARIELTQGLQGFVDRRDLTIA
jgi:hypothetical protein